MSLEEVRRFDDKLRTDVVFSGFANQFLGESSDGSRKHKISEFAKLNGFNFSTEELLRYSGAAHNISDENKSSAISESPLKSMLKSSVISGSSLTGQLNASHSENNRLQSFFIWLSGASPAILATCPESETKWQAALGASVLIPTLFAVIASSFALYSINTGIQFIIPVSLIWAFIILTMDRALLASYRSHLSFFNKLIQFVLRFFIAALIGLSVSHPLILIVFGESIHNKSVEHKEQTLKSLQSNYERENIALAKQIDGQRKILAEIRNSPIAACKTNAPESAAFFKQYQNKINKLGEEKNILLKQIGSLNEEITTLERRTVDEKMGKTGEGLTGKAGEGPEYRKITDKITRKNLEMNRVLDKIRMLESRISKEEILWSETIQKESEALRKSREENSRQCQDLINRQTDEMNRQAAQVSNIIAQLNEQKNKKLMLSESEQAKIRNKDKFDILSQTLFLHEIFKGEGGYVALTTFLVFGLLFMTVDTIPIILKFSSSGRIYDLKSSTYEFEAVLNDKLYRKGYEELAPNINDYRLSNNQEIEKTRIDHSHVRTMYKQLDDYLKMRERFISEFLQKERQERENTDGIQSELIRTRHEKDLNMLIDYVYEDSQTQMDRFFANRQNRQDEQEQKPDPSLPVSG